MAPKTVTVSVKYSKPGTQPPIFLAGSFSNPAWQPQEMQYTTGESDEHEFFKEVDVVQGKEYQYKFRIGMGDWWILNEDSPTDTDDAGNRNNVLTAPVTDGTIVSQPTEDIEKDASTEMEKSSDHNQPWAAREMTPEHIEEAMGTRESSDVLFSDEIIQDIEESKDVSLPMTPGVDGYKKSSLPITPNVEEPKVLSMPMTPDLMEPLEPHPTPAFEVPKTKADLLEDAKHSKEDHTVIADPTASAVAAAVPTPETALGESLLTPTPRSELETPHAEQIEGKEEECNAEPLHAPTVVVEKVDDEISYGDDFGPDATVAQKDAHSLRAQDAEPDHTIIRDTHTPDIADVAAEVADIAEDLDRDSPTPPISDEEAGRIGLRRMSNTPIPEVAKTAAEVADVAATLDKQELGDLLEARGYFAIIEDESIVFPETPENEKVPLFPHERGGSPERSGSRRRGPVDTPRRHTRPKEPAVYDPNDPTIQAFPADREGIMRELALIQQRLPPDTADCVGGVDSPITEEVHCPEKPISPSIHFQDQPLSLDSITEEDDDEEELLPNSANVNGNGLSKVEAIDEDKAEEPLVQVNGVQNVLEEPVQVENESTAAPATLVQGENAQPEPEPKPKLEDGSNLSVSAVAIPGIEPLLTHSIDGSLDGGKDDPDEAESSTKVPTVESQSKEPKLTGPIDRPEEMPLSVLPMPIPATPLIVGNRQLGHEEEEVQNITTPAGFSIQVQPATPRGSAADPDLGKTTAFEDKNGSTQIKARKRQPSPMPDRPLTPSSMRGKEQSKNFLKAFWRVVFVEWIGGLIMRLCNGGRGRQTLLAVGALALLASTPAVYRFFLARLVESRMRIP